jgi:Notch-like protein
MGQARGCPREGSPGLTCLLSCPPTGIDIAHLCQHGGLCVDTNNTHHCRCQAGYTGSYCEDEVDECSPSPCQNGATCTDYLGGYSCKVWAVPRWGYVA